MARHRALNRAGHTGTERPLDRADRQPKNFNHRWASHRPSCGTLRQRLYVRALSAQSGSSGPARWQCKPYKVSSEGRFFLERMRFHARPARERATSTMTAIRNPSQLVELVSLQFKLPVTHDATIRNWVMHPANPYVPSSASTSPTLLADCGNQGVTHTETFLTHPAALETDPTSGSA